jgi:hypothetical protein
MFTARAYAHLLVAHLPSYVTNAETLKKRASMRSPASQSMTRCHGRLKGHGAPGKGTMLGDGSADSPGDRSRVTAARRA